MMEGINMQKVEHEYIFSTAVSDSTDVNEFVIEFYSGNESEEPPIRVTRNFNELIEFLEEMDEA
jgi:hypothetical protein